MKPVAICINLLSRQRTQEHNIPGWIDWLNIHRIPFEIVDCYNYDIIRKLPNYSALLWHYSNFVNADLMEAQHILDIAANMGLKVFPDHYTGWHFDDKIAEMYALQAVGAPIPDSWVFYELDKCLQWLNNKADYPLVAKLRRGSGSNNVRLLRNSMEATLYAKRMFARGFMPAPSLLFKTYSKVQSTTDWNTFLRRFKQIPNFLKERKFGKGMPFEKGYCYFQQFIPNAGYDIKVAVVRDKLAYLVRKTRKGDFRASGGGNNVYDRSLMTKQIISSAFASSDALKMQCVGFDYVVDKHSGVGKIIEMCFGFDEEALWSSGGYFDRECNWHNEPLNVSIEVMEGIFGDIIK